MIIKDNSMQTNIPRKKACLISHVQKDSVPKETEDLGKSLESIEKINEAKENIHLLVKKVQNKKQNYLLLTKQRNKKLLLNSKTIMMIPKQMTSMKTL